MRATAATFKLGILVRELGAQGRSLHPFIRQEWQADLDVRVPQFLVAQPWSSASSPTSATIASNCRRPRRKSSPPRRNSRSTTRITSMPASTRNSCGDLPSDSASSESKGKIKEVKQNGESGFIESLVLHSGAGRRRRSVHRLHRLSRSADRTDAQDRVRGLVALAALRQRGRRADRADGARAAATHDRSRTMPAGAGASLCSIASATGWYSAASYLGDDAAKEELLAVDRRQAADGATRPQVSDRRGAESLEQELRRARSRQRLHRATRIDQHSSDDGRRHALDASVPDSAASRTSLIDQYNEAARIEMEKTRDFIVLHYHATERDDTAFWRHCRTCRFPTSLAHRIELFKESAYAYQGADELFRVDSWTQVMLGQRIMPKSYHHCRAPPQRSGAHQVPRRLPRIDCTDRIADAGSPGFREPVLQIEQ